MTAPFTFARTDDTTGTLNSAAQTAVQALIDAGAASTNATEIQGVAVDTTAPLTGQVLEYSGTAYAPATPSSDATSLRGVAVSATAPTSGQVLAYNGSTYAPATPSTDATSLQGVAVSATAPTSGQVLEYNGTAWTPTTAPGGGAPTDAEYIVASANAGLSAERVVTDTTEITFDTTTPGQLKANIGAVDFAKVTGTAPASQGGTGLSTLTANWLLAGNDAGPVNLIDHGGSGNYLRSDGTRWGRSGFLFGDIPATGTPNALSYLRGDAAWAPVAPPWHAHLTADVTTTSTTAANVTGLSIAVGASQTWIIHAHILGLCNNTGGTFLSWTVPTGATGTLSISGHTTSNTTYSSASWSTLTGGPLKVWSFAGTSPLLATVVLYLVTSTTAGTAQVQVASGTAGQTSTVSAGSHVLAYRVA